MQTICYLLRVFFSLLRSLYGRLYSRCPFAPTSHHISFDYQCHACVSIFMCLRLRTNSEKYYLDRKNYPNPPSIIRKCAEMLTVVSSRGINITAFSLVVGYVISLLSSPTRHNITRRFQTYQPCITRCAFWLFINIALSP